MAFPLRAKIAREELESEIREIKELIEDLQSQLERLENSRCDECDPDGQIIDETRIHSVTIDVPYKICLVCGGTKVKQ